MVKGFTVVKMPLVRALAGIPVEDAFGYMAGEPFVMVAADGATRDYRDGTVLTKSLEGLVKARLQYPIPDPAADAANIFVESAIDTSQIYNGSMNQQKVRDLFQFGNMKIEQYWKRKNVRVDYLANDYPGCVASFAHVKKGRELNYGFICDAGVAVVRKNGYLKMKTKDEGPGKHDPYIWSTDEMKNLKWEDPEARFKVRSIFRNNPDHPIHGTNTFGVLTGEEAAMGYVRTGNVELDEGNTVMVYTDGVEHMMFENGDVRGEFADIVRNGMVGVRRFCKRGVRSEGTLVYARV